MARNIDQSDRNRKVPEIRAGPAAGDSVAGTGGMWARMRQKPFSLWVIAGGLVYMALSLLYLGLPFAIMGGILAGGGFLLILFVFVAVFLIAAAFSFRQKRWAYVLAAVSSLVLLVLFGSFLLGSASNPADSGFWLSMSGLPALTLVVIFSILSLRSAKTGLAQKRYLASPHSTGGLLTLAVIGFVIGGLVAGAIGSAVIGRLVATAGESADVKIVKDAPSAAVPFNPATFHVAVGGTVTWLNTDSTTHTVTSDIGDSVAFDSGSLTTGGVFQFTFMQAGTYPYHCTPHLQMTGTIVVG